MTLIDRDLLCNTAGVDIIKYENSDMDFKIGFSMIDRNKSSLSSQGNDQINDHISDLVLGGREKALPSFL